MDFDNYVPTDVRNSCNKCSYDHNSDDKNINSNCNHCFNGDGDFNVKIFQGTRLEKEMYVLITDEDPLNIELKPNKCSTFDYSHFAPAKTSKLNSRMTSGKPELNRFVNIHQTGQTTKISEQPCKRKAEDGSAIEEFVTSTRAKCVKAEASLKRSTEINLLAWDDNDIYQLGIENIWLIFEKGKTRDKTHSLANGSCEYSPDHITRRDRQSSTQIISSTNCEIPNPVIFVNDVTNEHALKDPLVEHSICKSDPEKFICSDVILSEQPSNNNLGGEKLDAKFCLLEDLPNEEERKKSAIISNDIFKNFDDVNSVVHDAEQEDNVLEEYCEPVFICNRSPTLSTNYEANSIKCLNSLTTINSLNTEESCNADIEIEQSAQDSKKDNYFQSVAKCMSDNDNFNRSNIVLHQSPANDKSYNISDAKSSNSSIADLSSTNDDFIKKFKLEHSNHKNNSFDWSENLIDRNEDNDVIKAISEDLSIDIVADKSSELSYDSETRTNPEGNTSWTFVDDADDYESDHLNSWQQAFYAARLHYADRAANLENDDEINVLRERKVIDGIINSSLILACLEITKNRIQL
ncbi:hypothetical protein GJ496_004671 [Pomphorhynchus laevis]|nr:hypothetical protein GJ496_004671 [Pomphorhynchus laevis]